MQIKERYQDSSGLEEYSSYLINISAGFGGFVPPLSMLEKAAEAVQQYEDRQGKDEEPPKPRPNIPLYGRVAMNFSL
jgi:hypothetical protein